jgi:hypothetical protein
VTQLFSASSRTRPSELVAVPSGAQKWAREPDSELDYLGRLAQPARTSANVRGAQQTNRAGLTEGFNPRAGKTPAGIDACRRGRNNALDDV